MGAPRNGNETTATNWIPTSDISSQRAKTKIPETSRSENASSGSRKWKVKKVKRTGRSSGIKIKKIESFKRSSRSGQNQ